MNNDDGENGMNHNFQIGEQEAAPDLQLDENQKEGAPANGYRTDVAKSSDVTSKKTKTHSGKTKTNVVP